MSTDSEVLRRIAANEQVMWDVGRKAVEDALIDFRDSRIFIVGRNNGCVCKERDGTESSTIRLSIENAVKIAMLAMADHFEAAGPLPATT